MSRKISIFLLPEFSILAAVPLYKILSNCQEEILSFFYHPPEKGRNRPKGKSLDLRNLLLTRLLMSYILESHLRKKDGLMYSGQKQEMEQDMEDIRMCGWWE